MARLLRCMPGAADVDADCGALELRLSHFLDHRYKQQPHEALGGQTRPVSGRATQQRCWGRRFSSLAHLGRSVSILEEPEGGAS